MERRLAAIVLADIVGYIEADRVKKLKKAAIDLERSASDIVEEAVQAWLEKFEKRKA